MDDPVRLADPQYDAAAAIKFSESGAWECMSLRERGLFQLRQGRLLMPFGKFHEAIEALMQRPVFTHEMANPDSLWDELHGKIPKADFQAILDKLPSNKTVVVLS